MSSTWRKSFPTRAANIYTSRMHWQRVYLGILIVGSAVMWGVSLSLFSIGDPWLASDAPVVEAAAPVLSVEEAFPYVIEPRSTLFSTLRGHDVSPAVIQQLVDAAKPVQNLARLQSGIRYQLTFHGDDATELAEMRIRLSAVEMLHLKKNNGSWYAEKIVEQVDLQIVTFSGLVTSSLWDSAIKAQMDPNLVAELADIFGWEVDFSREVRVNDRWRLAVERKLVKGQPIGWGAILAAEYENAGVSHQAAIFRVNGQEMGYFTPKGESLRKMFLKSPIRYGRITSGFNLRRFHPILNVRRPHLGVDYGAPVGTPVRAVGDGTVTSAGWSGGGGNVLKIRHNGTYQTAYKHLQSFARGVRSGTRVSQGQVVAYVGNTGLSTGPHLHFEFYQNGSFVDPLSKKFPSADPVPANQLQQFQTEAALLLQSLPAWENVEITANNGPGTTQ